MVVLDSSVLVYAVMGSDPNSVMRRVVRFAATGVYDCVMSHAIREEATSVLGRADKWTKPLSPAEVNVALEPLWKAVHWMDPAPDDPAYLPIVRDPKDVVVLRTAAAVVYDPVLGQRRAKWLVSENTRHFRPSVNWAGV